MTATTPLALTTTFTPPPACSTDTWYIEYVKGTYYYTTSISNSLEGWYLSQGPTDWSSCFPSGYQATTDFYYSPGVCPSGYSIASSEILSIGISSETRATCCPSSYTAQTDNGLVWYSTNRCFSVETDTDHVWTVTKGGTVTDITSSGGINAKAVFIRWQETDFQTPAMTTTDSTGTSTRTSQGPSATGTTAAADPSQEQSSRAWIAGPVIGAVVACALIVLAAIWYNRRRRRRESSNAAGSASAPGYHIAELDEGHRVFEAPSGKIYPGPFELPSTNHT